MKLSFSSLFFLIGFLLGAHSLSADEAIDEIKAFSQFQNVNLQQVSNGEILLLKGPSMDFERGLTGEACFAIPFSPEKSSMFYKNWDTSQNESLKVWLHRSIQIPPTDDDFKDLHAIFQDKKYRWLIDKTKAISPGSTDLLLNKAELIQIFRCFNTESDAGVAVEKGWKEILMARVTKHQNEGLSKNLPLEVGRLEINIQSEFDSILKDQPGIKKQFSSLLEKTLLSQDSSHRSLSPSYYWELDEINKHPAFNLGVVYIVPLENGKYQILDYVFYSSSEIFAEATLREAWPIKINGKDFSLIWRGDLVSASDLESVHGIERMAASRLMLQEMKKSIVAFEDALTKQAQTK
jgi:hypothetical protein